jgi:ubiquinone/menaquinone biosynthesis C-methylase UbiE/uncharacterized protein YbaR (Trm112 family)
VIDLASLLVCPRCRGALVRREAKWRCEACAADYPVVAGIADFRLCRDPYISIEDDRTKALSLDASSSFDDALDRYYAMTPEVPRGDAERYAAHHRAGIERGTAIFERIDSYGLRFDDPLLDLGCGSGGFIAAAALQARSCVGADIALRWLVIARKRLAELAIEVPLVAACADHLPFAGSVFGGVVAENLLEHVSDVEAALREIVRVRSAGGGVVARCVNRFAPGPEPHVGLWGVGLLPRPIAERYVKARTGAMYRVRPPSLRSLQRAVRQAGTNDLDVRAGHILERDVRRRHGLERLFLAVFRRLERFRLARAAAPYLDVVGG